VVALLLKVSNSQAKRLIEQGAVTLLPQKVKVSKPLEKFAAKGVEGLKIGRQFFKLID